MVMVMVVVVVLSGNGGAAMVCGQVEDIVWLM